MVNYAECIALDKVIEYHQYYKLHRYVVFHSINKMFLWQIKNPNQNQPARLLN
jgi:hypothetical protein